MAQTGVQNYLNTLIFCVVAKTISILVLGSLVFKQVRPYVMFLLTIELGLVVVIVYSMWKISSYEKRMAKAADEIRQSSLMAVSCPDYYTRDVDDEQVNNVCTNGYTTPDGTFTYKFVGDKAIDSIPIDNMFRKTILKDACKMVIHDTDVYSTIPWSDLKPKCDAI